MGRKTLLERYWAKVTIGSPEKCWPWTAGVNHKGYGMIWDGTHRENGRPRMVVATRLGYRLRVGEIPDGLHVLHTCDTPACHNDDHWFLGTNRDNVRDKWSKGRGVVPLLSGDAHGASKITEAQVAEIQERYLAGGITQKTLAVAYGISQPQVHNIVHGRRRHASSSSSAAWKAASRPE